MILYITGGARSGKSRYAQTRALEIDPAPIYVATARRWDEEFSKRIDRHILDRDYHWINFEAEKYISQLPLNGHTVVIDCVTLWLTNYFSDLNGNSENAFIEFKNEFNKLCAIEASLIIISNEIGMGGHPVTESGRKFEDLQGWANQLIATQSTEAIFMVSGLPQRLK